MNARPEVSDEEIAKAMDFDRVLALLKESEAVSMRFRQKLIVGGSVLGLLTVALLLWWNTGTSERSANNQQKPASTGAVADSALKIRGAQPVSGNKGPAAKDLLPTLSTENKKAAAPKKTVYTKAPNNDALTVQKAPYTEAEPEGGFDALYAYFNRELQYPEAALADSIQGVLTVKFIINELGKPEQITILHSLGTVCDNEARRLIEHMPPWKPAVLDGKGVASSITVPLTFSIGKQKPVK